MVAKSIEPEAPLLNNAKKPTSRLGDQIAAELEKRIMVIDGAMGTMIQR